MEPASPGGQTPRPLSELWRPRSVGRLSCVVGLALLFRPICRPTRGPRSYIFISTLAAAVCYVRCGAVVLSFSVSSTSIDARTCQESVAAAVAVDTVAATASEKGDDANARRCRRLRRHRIHERDEPAVASHAIPAPQVPPARGGLVV
ncbi:hypothetical protein MRX96_039425 [Rhipicephalus microplus]